MSVPESADTGSNSGLFASLRSFWAVLVAILTTRLELATTELEETGAHAVRAILVGLAALLCVSMTIFFILFFLVATFWDQRIIVLGIISGVCVIGSIVLILVARHMVLTWPKLLGQTLEELKRDTENIRALAAKKEKEES